MRGKVQTAFTFLIDTGITPAYAGKSSFASCSFASFRDHPRLCGEKHNLFPQNRINHRITPAYAGKSLLWLEQPVAFQDHPRLCGEK